MEHRVYDDALGHRYEYDSNVINHRKVATGDLLVIRDRHLVYGFGAVQTITTKPGIKVMQRCRNANCNSADIKMRKRQLPRFRCSDCHLEFDDPVLDPMNVTEFSASYEAWWLPFQSPAPVRVLDFVYAGRDRQNAIRQLSLNGAIGMLRFHAGVEGNVYLQLLIHQGQIATGQVEALTRQRVGQQRFRERMLERFGSTCAVTGKQPESILDAAHLDAYAERHVHEEDGGLLLRADVHRLFDRLLLTFDPVTWRSCVAPALLERHEPLQAIHSQPIAVPASLRPSLDLIGQHHRAAKARWREMA
ncbi:HNH endonuclease [Angustibacter sp. McL0619]|uniref:HNH endonuclease n=1 Tax=Angustibacter sp. McL0619 TaxID=3415676 RepID=UPI003CEEBA81